MNSQSDETAPDDIEYNPFTKPEIAALWIKCVENVSGEFRDKHIYPRLRAWERSAPSGQILEIGCGQGVCCRDIPAERPYVGVEPSVPLVSRAVELYAAKNRNFVRGNAYQLPIAEAACSGAFSVNVWMHLSNLGRAAQELARVLRPGGGFFIVTANPASYGEWEKMHFNASRKGKRISGGFHLPVNIDLPEHDFFTHDLTEILASLEAAGFAMLETDTFGRAGQDSNLDWFVAIKGIKGRRNETSPDCA